MNTNVKNICEVVEDIKENITDYQYKTIMDNLMELNNYNNNNNKIEDWNAHMMSLYDRGLILG
jgi:hypothetical protein